MVNAGFEDEIVFVTLLAVGGLGLGLGILHPQASVELALGVLLVFFLLRARLGDALRARRGARGPLAFRPSSSDPKVPS